MKLSMEIGIVAGAIVMVAIYVVIWCLLISASDADDAYEKLERPDLIQFKK